MSALTSNPTRMLLALAMAVAAAAALLLISRPIAPPVTTEVVRRTSRGQSTSSQQLGHHGPQAYAAASGGVELPADDAMRRYLIPVTHTQPSLGPSSALVTVVNWCGFRTPHCREADPIRDRLLAEYGDDLRWVHRSLPEGPGDFLAYVFAHAAHHQGEKFWEARELLTAMPLKRIVKPDEINAMSVELGLDWQTMAGKTRFYALTLEADQILAKQFAVQGPSYFVNGRRLQRPALSVLEKNLRAAIDRELEHARQILEAGTTRDEVYETVVKDGYWGVDDVPEARRAASDHVGEREDH